MMTVLRFVIVFFLFSAQSTKAYFRPDFEYARSIELRALADMLRVPPAPNDKDVLEQVQKEALLLGLELRAEISEIARAFALSDQQKEKLRSAGQQDIDEFCQSYEKAIRKLSSIDRATDLDKLIREARRLQAIMLKGGLFQQDSSKFRRLAPVR